MNTNIKSLSFLLVLMGLLFVLPISGQEISEPDQADDHKIYLPIVINPAIPPYVGTSYYLQDTDILAISNLGCRIGNEAFVSGSPIYYTYIHVGQPMKQLQVIDGIEVEVSGILKHGSEEAGLPNEFVTMEHLRESMLLLVMNAVECLDSDDQLIRFGIGPSNFGSDVSFEQGANWGEWVEDLTQSVESADDSGIGGKLINRVQIVGAIDIEMGFNGPEKTKEWVSGYYSTSSILYNMGTLGGCPSKFAPNFTCGTPDQPDWQVDDIEEIFDHLGARAIPQIYDEFGINAAQWVYLAQLREGNPQFPFRLVGAMSQQAACEQRGGCDGIDNSPQDAFGQLLFQLNEADTSPQKLDLVTDIVWQID